MAPGAHRRERFEELVRQALDELPEWVQEKLDNVEVVIEEDAPRDEPNLLGLYHGVPLTERGLDYAGVLPDRIALYRRTIEEESGGQPEPLKQVVRHTVVHEIAHFFGITDDRLRDLDRY